MLNIKIVELHENLLRYVPIGLVIGVIFLLEVFLIIDRDLVSVIDNSNSIEYTTWSNQVASLTNIEALGQLLYTHYFLYFIVASIILLVAMIGAIVLSLTNRGRVRKQDIYQQVSKNYEEVIHLKV